MSTTVHYRIDVSYGDDGPAHTQQSESVPLAGDESEIRAWAVEYAERMALPDVRYRVVRVVEEVVGEYGGGK